MEVRRRSKQWVEEDDMNTNAPTGTDASIFGPGFHSPLYLLYQYMAKYLVKTQKDHYPAEDQASMAE